MARRTYRKITVSTWDKFRELVEGPDLKSWAFRGHANFSWRLYSTLSRHLLDFRVDKRAWRKQEERILRIFRRKAHLFLTHVPDADDSFQWLALMQHHGAPTRLLDFTWSPYVAAFFALEEAKQDSAIWALFPPRLTEQTIRSIRTSQKEIDGDIGPWIRGMYEEMFLPNKNKIVVMGEPERMNQRLIAQSGTFVIPGVLDDPVEELAFPDSIVKVILKHGMRKKAMAELYNMNINNASLFPGIDGLAQSLAYELEFHWAFDPKTMKKRKGFSLD